MLARSLMMATTRGPQFVSYAAGVSNNALTVTVNKPVGTTEGDVLVAVMGAGGDFNADTWTGDTGWTERVSAATAPFLRVATLSAGASEPSSYTFTLVSPAPQVPGMFCIILCTRNTQWDTIGSLYSGAAPVTMSGITAAGGLLIAAVADYGATPPSHSTPSGMITTTTEDSVNGGGVSAFYANVLAGATGSKTSTGTGNQGVLLSLKAA